MTLALVVYGLSRLAFLHLAIDAECREQHVPVAIVRRLVAAESSWRESAVGDDGQSVGLWQINMAYYDDFKDRFNGGRDFDPRDGAETAHVAIGLLASLYAYFDDWRLSVAAYRAGTSTITSGMWTARTAAYVNKIVGGVR